MLEADLQEYFAQQLGPTPYYSYHTTCGGIAGYSPRPRKTHHVNTVKVPHTLPLSDGEVTFVMTPIADEVTRTRVFVKGCMIEEYPTPAWKGYSS